MKEILDKDYRSRKVMFYILLLSLFVSAVDSIISIKDAIPQNKLSGEFNILTYIGPALTIIPTVLQLMLSIIGLRKNAKQGNYENAGQTALMIITILTTVLAPIITQLINLFLYKQFTFKSISPFTSLFVIFFIITGLCTFVKHNVLRKQYKTLKFLQIIMSVLGVLFYVLNFKLLLNYIESDFISKACFYANFAIVALFTLEALSCLIYLTKHRKELNEEIFKTLDYETISTKNGKTKAKIYIERGTERNKLTKTAYILGIIFIILTAIFLIIAISNNIENFKVLANSKNHSTLELAMSSILIIHLFVISFTFINFSYALITTKKNLYTNLVSLSTFILLYIYYGEIFSLSGPSMYLGTLPLIAIFFVISVFGKINQNIEEAIRSGEWSSKISKKIAIINIICSIAMFVLLTAFVVYFKLYIYILLISAMVLSFIIFVVELKYPKPEYYIINHKD